MLFYDFMLRKNHVYDINKNFENFSYMLHLPLITRKSQNYFA